MNPRRVRSLPGLLLLVLTVACASPPDAPPSDGAPVLQPRVWLGLALAGEGTTPNSVVFVVNGASAAEAGIQAGDALVDLAGREISGPMELAATVPTLRARHAVEAVVLRDGEELAVQVVPGVLVFAEDPPTRTVDDKRCDEECRCSIDHPDAVCGQAFVHSGDGPNGGVLYTIGCAAVSIEDLEELPGGGACGPYEFF